MNHVQRLLVVAMAACCFAFIAQVQATIPSECAIVGPIETSQYKEYVPKCVDSCSGLGWRYVSSTGPLYNPTSTKLQCCCTYDSDDEAPIYAVLNVGRV